MYEEYWDKNRFDTGPIQVADDPALHVPVNGAIWIESEPGAKFAFRQVGFARWSWSWTTSRILFEHGKSPYASF